MKHWEIVRIRRLTGRLAPFRFQEFKSTVAKDTGSKRAKSHKKLAEMVRWLAKSGDSVRKNGSFAAILYDAFLGTFDMFLQAASAFRQESESSG
jgi:transposase-like protein